MTASTFICLSVRIYASASGGSGSGSGSSSGGGSSGGGGGGGGNLHAVPDSVGDVDPAAGGLRSVDRHWQPQPAPRLARRRKGPAIAPAAVGRAADGGGVGRADGADEGAVGAQLQQAAVAAARGIRSGDLGEEKIFDDWGGARLETNGDGDLWWMGWEEEEVPVCYAQNAAVGKETHSAWAGHSIKAISLSNRVENTARGGIDEDKPVSKRICGRR
jgi:hypothetical protein